MIAAFEIAFVVDFVAAFGIVAASGADIVADEVAGKPGDADTAAAAAAYDFECALMELSYSSEQIEKNFE